MARPKPHHSLFRGLFRHTVAVDLGTANTLIYTDDGGIVLSLMPSCANASQYPATINVTTRASLEKIELYRRVLMIDPSPANRFPVSIRFRSGSRM